VEIAVAANWRAWATIRGAPEIVGAFKRACRERARGDALLQTGSRRRDVVEHPMDPCHLWRGRVGCIGVVDDQRETSRFGGYSGPRERRRHVRAIAGVAFGNLASRGEGVRVKVMVRSSGSVRAANPTSQISRIRREATRHCMCSIGFAGGGTRRATRWSGRLVRADVPQSGVVWSSPHHSGI
jgi:hypothetical protein